MRVDNDGEVSVEQKGKEGEEKREGLVSNEIHITRFSLREVSTRQ
jgi:hypothetical protein